MKEIERGGRILKTRGVVAFATSIVKYLTKQFRNFLSKLSPPHIYRKHVVEEGKDFWYVIGLVDRYWTGKVTDMNLESAVLNEKLQCY